jgi:hypothetical protein
MFFSGIVFCNENESVRPQKIIYNLDASPTKLCDCNSIEIQTQKQKEENKKYNCKKNYHPSYLDQIDQIKKRSELSDLSELSNPKPTCGIIFLSDAIKIISEHYDKYKTENSEDKIKVYLEACLADKDKEVHDNIRDNEIEIIQKNISTEQTRIRAKEEKLQRIEKSKRQQAVNKQRRDLREQQKQGGATLHSDDTDLEKLKKLQYENSYITRILKTSSKSTKDDCEFTYIYTHNQYNYMNNLDTYETYFIFNTKTEISVPDKISKLSIHEEFDYSMRDIITIVKPYLTDSSSYDLYRCFLIILIAFEAKLKSSKYSNFKRIFKEYVYIDLTKYDITTYSVPLINSLLQQLQDGVRYESISSANQDMREMDTREMDTLRIKAKEAILRNKINAAKADKAAKAAEAAKEADKAAEEEDAEAAKAVKAAEAAKDAKTAEEEAGYSAGGYGKKYITLTNKKHKKHKKKHTKHKKKHIKKYTKHKKKHRKNRKTQKY